MNEQFQNLEQPQGPWYLTHKFLYSVLVVLLLIVVGGIWYYAQIQKETAKVLQQANSVAPTLRSGQSDVPSDWKTYTNEQYGFEFKYPPEWSSGSGTTQYGNFSGSSISFGAVGDMPPKISIEVFDSIQGEAIPGAVKRITAIDTSVVKNTELKVDGIEGKYFKNIPGESSYNEAVFIRNNKVYGIIQLTDDNTFNQILSTFKFTK